MNKPATESLTLQASLALVLILILKANADVLPFVVPELAWQVLMGAAGLGAVYGLRRAVDGKSEAELLAEKVAGESA